MSRHNAQLRRRPRRSLTQQDLVPDLGVAVGSVALTVGLHWATLPGWLGEGLSLLLLASTAAALTSWRGLGSGMLARLARDDRRERDVHSADSHVRRRSP